MVCLVDGSKNGKCVSSGSSKIRKWGKVELTESGKKDVKAAVANKRKERNKMFAQIQHYNKEATDKASLPLKAIALPIFVLLQAACGGEEPKVPQGQETTIDDFDSVNSYNSYLKGTWTGFNGFNISIKNGVLRAEGAGSWPGFNVKTGMPVDISKFKYIMFDVRGSVSQIQTEVFRVDMTRHTYNKGTISTEFEPYWLDMKGLQELGQFQIMAASNNANGWVEIDNLRLVK